MGSLTDFIKHLTRAYRYGRPNIDPADAKRVWSEYRQERGWGPNAPLLSPPSANMKLRKDADNNTYGLSLAPSDASGTNICKYATPECKRGCVAYSGNGLYPRVGLARMLKVDFLQDHPLHFVTLLAHELAQVDAHVRLNTFSDLPWERIAPWLVERGRLYDYTKHPDRVSTSAYNLTYSASERTTDADIHAMLGCMNVAVVFDTPRTRALPPEYLGVPVIDGDKTDARWLDPRPAIVGLRAKGRMRSNIAAWGMVRHANQKGNT